MPKLRLTEEQKLDLLDRIDAHIQETGASTKDAAELFGLSVDMLYYYRGQRAKGEIVAGRVVAGRRKSTYPEDRPVYGNLILHSDYRDLTLCTAWRWCRRNPEAMSDLMPDDPLKFLRERGRA